MDIPEKGTGCWTSRNGGTTGKLRKLKVGDSITLPRSARGIVGACASSIGIKVVTRSLGSKDTFTIWRIA